jgi:Flp pilus assembly pilin Flp
MTGARHSSTRLLRRLRREQRGASAIEFALILPVFLTLSLYGTEIAYMASVDMQLSQIATSLADNASRLGQTDNSAVTPSISAGEVESVLLGAMKQGDPLDITTKGRVILSSLEEDVETGDQFIHWQKCSGTLTEASRYGEEGGGLDSATAITGVGESGGVRAASLSAVMVAEVYYKHEGLFGTTFVGEPILRKEGVFQIRDDRDLAPGVTGDASSISC